MTAYRAPIAFAALAILFVLAGLYLGQANITLVLVQTVAYALIALGLNVQWGYGGLFNFGIMGFLMVGGLAVTTMSAPVNSAFWDSDGPLWLGRVVLAIAVGAALIIAARRADRIGIRGRWRSALIVIAWIAAYVIVRTQLDPATTYIQQTAGWVGGLGQSPILGWALGGVAAAGIAYVVGRIALGLRTDYLAIATIGISEILRALMKNGDWLSRGTLTVSPLPWPTPLPQALQADGASIASSFIVARLWFLAVVVVVLAVIFFLVQRAYAGPWGRMMRAIRDNHVAAGAMGKNVKGRQIEVFVLGSALMAIGGGILVTFSQIYDPSSYLPINHTFLIWVMLIVGGSGNNWGAVFGAMLIYLTWVVSDPLAQEIFTGINNVLIDQGWGEIPDIASRSSQMRVFILGLVISLALRYAPRGLIPEVVGRPGRTRPEKAPADVPEKEVPRGG